MPKTALGVKSPKNSGIISPIVIILILLIVGVGAGMILGKGQFNLKGITGNTSKENNLSDDASSASAGIITRPKKEWGTLVSNIYVNMRVQGSLISTEKGTYVVGDGREIQGYKMTLKNGGDQATYFVSIGAETMQGKLDDYGTWKKTELANFKAGDKVTLRLEAALQDDATPESYVGIWAFRQQ